jgi:hypothetical protein
MAEAKEKGGERADRKRRVAISIDAVRTRVAQLIWLVCVVFALFLAVGALTYALKANPDNGLVDFVRNWADRVDLSVFSQENGVKEFVGKNSDTKNALFNWGLGAIFWLVLGRVLDRIVRP